MELILVSFKFLFFIFISQKKSIILKLADGPYLANDYLIWELKPSFHPKELFHLKLKWI